MLVHTYFFFCYSIFLLGVGGGLSPPRTYKGKGQILFLPIPALFSGRLAFTDCINGLPFPLAFDWV